MKKREQLKHFLISKGLFYFFNSKLRDLQKTISLVSPQSLGVPLIRLGGNGDGGYLLPDDMEGITACFSPGVDFTALFEKELATKYHIKSYLADYSVSQSPEDSEYIHFEKKFLGTKNNHQFTRLEDWFERHTIATPNGDYLLQMDIEGAEFEVILDTPQHVLRQFRTIIIEFHGMEKMFHSGHLKKIKSVFEKLTQNHLVAHIHPNNGRPLFYKDGIEIPKVFEMTLYRKNCCNADQAPLAFPHKLDRTNVTSKPDFSLPKTWQ
jgi:hypothetical protein